MNAAAGTNPRLYAVNNISPGAGSAARITSANIYGRYDWKATVTGAVTVVVFEFTGSSGGDYFISATKLNGGCGGQALSCNSILDNLISTPLSFNFYTLQANAGDVYQFRTARFNPSSSFVPTAEIYDASGAKVGAVGPAAASGYATATSQIALPSSGTFTVIVSGPRTAAPANTPSAPSASTGLAMARPRSRAPAWSMAPSAD